MTLSGVPGASTSPLESLDHEIAVLTPDRFVILTEKVRPVLRMLVEQFELDARPGAWLQVSDPTFETARWGVENSQRPDYQRWALWDRTASRAYPLLPGLAEQVAHFLDNDCDVRGTRRNAHNGRYTAYLNDKAPGSSGNSTRGTDSTKR